ncbi:MAG: AraC family transcriptional regulator [Oscillospiraceae bacterium]|nr:AraC family transcriptional regulator [Oscillospiraceae bacterium]
MGIYCRQRRNTAGIQRCLPAHAWGPAIRDHYLIHYIVHGKGRFSTGGHTWDLQAGDAFFMRPNVIARYEADEADPWEYDWVGFNGSDAIHLLRQTGLFDMEPVFHCPPDNRFHELLTNITAVSGSDSSAEARMESGLLLFLSALMDTFGVHTPRSDSSYCYVQKAIQFIDRNYSGSIDIEKIAQSAGVSRSHLYRLFIAYVNMPPNEYLTRYRISKAASFLSDGGLTVGEAAYSAGFADQLYFSRVFKKYMGVPPSKFCSSKKRHSV